MSVGDVKVLYMGGDASDSIPSSLSTLISHLIVISRNDHYEVKQRYVQLRSTSVLSVIHVVTKSESDE